MQAGLLEFANDAYRLLRNGMQERDEALGERKRFDRAAQRFIRSAIRPEPSQTPGDSPRSPTATAVPLTRICTPMSRWRSRNADNQPSCAWRGCRNVCDSQLRSNLLVNLLVYGPC